MNKIANSHSKNSFSKIVKFVNWLSEIILWLIYTLSCSSTLLCLIVGGGAVGGVGAWGLWGDQIANFWFPQVHLVIMREWPKSNPTILRNLDNFPQVHFIQTGSHVWFSRWYVNEMGFIGQTSAFRIDL